MYGNNEKFLVNFLTKIVLKKNKKVCPTFLYLLSTQKQLLPFRSAVFSVFVFPTVNSLFLQKLEGSLSAVVEPSMTTIIF